VLIGTTIHSENTRERGRGEVSKGGHRWGRCRQQSHGDSVGDAEVERKRKRVWRENAKTGEKGRTEVEHDGPLL
jgi:hypothetical protein